MLKVVVLVSGGGTNLQAIIDGVKGGVIRNTTVSYTHLTLPTT